MRWIGAIVILCLIVYALFSKSPIKPRKIEDEVKDNPYSRTNDELDVIYFCYGRLALVFLEE